jgi:hypothetical protein
LRLGIPNPLYPTGSGTFEMVQIGEGGSVGQSYCIASPNSVSAGGCHISASGSTRLSANDLVLTAQPTPMGTPGLFFYGDLAVQLPLGNGTRCAGGAIKRVYPVHYPPSQTASVAFDNTLSPHAETIQAGETFYFQWWYRDTAAGGQSSAGR